LKTQTTSLAFLYPVCQWIY